MKINIYDHFICLVRQINSRHAFLSRFIGTKGKEKLSYNKVNEAKLWITVTTGLCCALEIILYFVYNRMVKNLNYNTRHKSY